MNVSAKQWAVVSGATSGIGLATAKELLKVGYSVLALGRREENFQEILESVENPRLHFLKIDVREKTQIPRLSQFIIERQGALEVLVNSAELAKGVEGFAEGKLDDWDQMIETNIQGLLYLTRELLPLLLKSQKAHIVNLGSVAGRWVYPGGAVYAATKFAVRALSEGMRMDLIGKNVRVTNIEPGMVESEFSMVRLGDKKLADKVYQGMKPLTPEDIADTIIWTISRPAHVNIQEIVIFPTDQAAVGQVWRQQ